MFRLRVSDKFQHVLSRLQAMVTANHKFCTPILLPRYITLEELDKNDGLELRAKIDSVYHEKELTVAVAFRQSDTTISLLGVSRRSWENPTLEFDDAVHYGLEYKGFRLPLANITNPSARNNISLDKVCEILHINVVNLQMKREADAPDEKFLWCSWIQKLPAPYDVRHSDTKLPQWMSDRSVKKTCESMGIHMYRIIISMINNSLLELPGVHLINGGKNEGEQLLQKLLLMMPKSKKNFKRKK